MDPGRDTAILNVETGTYSEEVRILVKVGLIKTRDPVRTDVTQDSLRVGPTVVIFVPRRTHKRPGVVKDDSSTVVPSLTLVDSRPSVTEL